MAGTPLIVSAALTTGSFLPGAANLASHPGAQALTLVLMLIALTMAAYGAWCAENGPVRHVPPGPALPHLRRRIKGPRDRRS